ncbi:MAG: uroporphyrinogen-III synthase, partial [Candidatus Helarchaeota archaeon]
MLKNVRIAITRPEEQQSTLKKLLEEQGAIVLSRPLIKIEEFRHKRRIRQVLDLIINNHADIVVFTSVNGVKHVIDFAKKIKILEKLKKKLNALIIAAIGEKTAKELNSEGIKVDLIPKNFTNIELGNLLIKQRVENKRIFLLRANIATEELPNMLLKAGATVIDFTVYKVVPEKIEKIRHIIDEIISGKIDIIVFTSAFSANTLFGYTDRKSYQNLLDQAIEKVKLVAIGPVTKNALENIGF